MNYLFKLFAASLLLFSFCKSQAQDGASLIPDNSIMVGDFNLKKITAKANYKMLENFYWFGKMDYEIERDNRQNYEQVSKLYKNPSEAGLDTTGHIYWFLYRDSSGTNPGFIVPVKDKKKFDQTFLALNRRKSAEDIKTYKGARYIVNFNDLLLWNDNYFIYAEIPRKIAYLGNEYGYDSYDYVAPVDTTPTDAPEQEDEEEKYKKRQEEYDRLIEQKIEELLHLPHSKSISANADFNSFKNKEYDMALWMNLSNLSDSNLLRQSYPENIFGSFSGIMSQSLKSSYVHSYASFNKGEIVVSIENIMNPQLAKQTEKLYNNKFNTQMLNYIKKDSLISIFSMNLNAHEFYSYLNQGGNKNITNKASAAMAAAIFNKELRKDPGIIAINQQIDSLSEIAYPYYGRYNDYNDYTTDSVAVAAPYAEEYETATEESVEETPKESKKEKKNRKKKEKASKVKKKKKKQSQEESIEESEYREYSEQGTDYYEEEPDYEKQAAAQRALDSLYKVKDSLENVLALGYLKEKGLSAEDLWHFVKGDLAGAITRLYYRDIEYISYEYDDEMQAVETKKTKKEFTPEYVFTATVDRKDKLELFLQLLEDKGILIREGSVYKLVFNKNMPDNYFYIHDNIFFITNRHQLALGNSKGVSSSVGNDPVLSKLVVNSPCYFSADISAIMKASKDQVHSKEAKEMMRSVEKNISKFIMTNTYPSGNSATSKIKIEMKEANESSVLSIFKLIEGIFLADRVY